MDKYSGDVEVMGPDQPQISGVIDQRSETISGIEIARELFVLRQAGENTVVLFHGHVAPLEVHRGEKRST
jgi:translation elongation factor EF-Tu-like GTPase